MGDNRQEETTDYKFLREKVIKRRKSKLKHFLLLVTGTVVLGAVFGVVARICFMKSEPFVNRIIGVTPTSVPTTPSKIPLTFPAKVNSPTPVITKNPSPTPVIPSSDLTSVPGVQGSPIDPGETEDPGTDLLPEKQYELTVKDFTFLYHKVGEVAQDAGKSLVVVNAVSEETSWLDETIEERETTVGLVLGNNGVELLVMVPLDRIVQANRIEVVFGGFTILNGFVLSKDVDYNLAIVGVKLDEIPPAAFSQIVPCSFGESSTISMGTPIIAVGSPNGYYGSFEFGTITGIGSCSYIMDDRLELFTTSLLDRKNGDSVIINVDGEIIGLVTHLNKNEKNEGLNTAIGISRLKPVIQALANDEDRPYIGVITEEIPTSTLYETGLTHGVYVREVIDNSPAAEAGIRKGDVISSIGTNNILSVAALHGAITFMKSDDVVTVKVMRAVRQSYSEVTLSVKIKNKQ